MPTEEIATNYQAINLEKQLNHIQVQICKSSHKLAQNFHLLYNSDETVHITYIRIDCIVCIRLNIIVEKLVRMLNRKQRLLGKSNMF